MKALYSELSHRLENSKHSFKSVYIGGGTPSCIKPLHYEKIFDLLDKYMQKGCEITIEANPNSLTKEWIDDMCGLGVNRLSIGVQSFNDAKLKLLGRSHESLCAQNAIKAAQRSQIDSISIDIMYATLLDTKKNIDFELEYIKKFDISHISSYSLTLEENTPFQTRYDLQDDDDAKARYLINGLEKIGFKQYEVSNFAKKSKISEHNTAYWRYEEYLGAGCGAVGFENGSRYVSNLDVESYIANPLYKEFEPISKEDQKFEKLFLGLRSSVGVDIGIFNSCESMRLNQLLKEKKVYTKLNKVYCSDLLLSDEIALFIQS